MHVILGAGGAIANALTKELIAKGEKVRLVSRRPITTFAEVQWIQADLTQLNEVLTAAKGASVLYLCAGLPYNTKVWAAQWPLIMNHLVEAGITTGARLIFFDNVYMYGRVHGPMTEETPYNPCSKKGEIRARIAEQLISASRAGTVKATIARAADFYGAESLNSFFDSMVIQKYARGQKAMWLGNLNSRHSYTYVPDAGKALYLLGQQPDTINEIYHVPTASALTGREFMELAAQPFHRKPSYSSVNKFMLQLAGLFNPVIRETVEMYYQYRYDYAFDSSKFEQKFGVQPTPYDQGIKTFSSFFNAKTE